MALLSFNYFFLSHSYIFRDLLSCKTYHVQRVNAGYCIPKFTCYVLMTKSTTMKKIWSVPAVIPNMPHYSLTDTMIKFTDKRILTSECAKHFLCLIILIQPHQAIWGWGKRSSLNENFYFLVGLSNFLASITVTIASGWALTGLPVTLTPCRSISLPSWLLAGKNWM